MRCSTPPERARAPALRFLPRTRESWAEGGSSRSQCILSQRLSKPLSEHRTIPGLHSLRG